MISDLFYFPELGEVTLFFPENGIETFVVRQLAHYHVRRISEKASSDPDIRLVTSCDAVIEWFDSNIGVPYDMGRNLRLSKEGCRCEYLKYELEGSTLEISFRSTKSVLNTCKNIFHKIESLDEDRKYAHHMGIFYREYLAAIFSLYSIVYGMRVVHGSLLEYNGTNILLTGLDGVGKSTLSNVLVKIGAKLLADNIVLFDGRRGLNFSLAMRLDRIDPSEVNVQYRGKDFYEVLPKDHRVGIVSVKRVYNLAKSYGTDELCVYRHYMNPAVWEMFLNNAPEIGVINKILSGWNYCHYLKKQDEGDNTLEVVDLVIPQGRLDQAEEYIAYEC